MKDKKFRKDKIVSIRMTDDDKKMIIKLYGGIQKFFDKYLQKIKGSDNDK